MEPATTDTNALDISLSNEDLLTLLKTPIRESQSYWEKDFGLESARTRNMNLWMPNHWKDKEVYDYQEDSLYADPRVFISTETLTANVNARVPQLEVMPAQDNVISLQIAKDMNKAVQAYIKKFDVLDLFRLSARGLQLKRGGFIKLRWDPNKGQFGEIVSEFVDATDVIVDKDAKMGQIPRFFTHIIRNHTVEELIALLPDGREQILAMAGANRRDKKGNLVAYKTQLGKKFDVYETWFRYLENGKWVSAVCWTDANLQYVFDKDGNPNWNTDEKEDRLANFLDEPAPPFIPINYLNDGSSYFDLTTLIEQAGALQRILDKRGFQVMENADQAGGGIVFNTQMITKDDMAKLVGSPDERIGVKGNVRDAISRVAPAFLPSYVIEDKNDARKEIDAVFGTYDIVRGERSNAPTLGQDQLQLGGAMTRMDEMARAVERQARHYSRYLLQMMKVYYTKEHYLVASGENGSFDFVMMKNDMVENGADVYVTEGSMRMPDRASQQKWVGDLAKLGMIDPLTVYEVAAGGTMPSPRVMLQRFMTYKTNPMAFMEEAKEEDFSREALMDIQELNTGTMPKMRDEYSDTYMKFLNNYMLRGEFDKLPANVQAVYASFVSMVHLVIKQQLAKLMSQMPSQPEIDAQNRGTAEQVALEGQIQQGMPQLPQGGSGGSSVPQPGATPNPNDLASQMLAAKQPAAVAA